MVNIEVEDDKTHTVVYSDGEWLRVRGLTAEQAVAIKQLVTKLTDDARRHALTSASYAIHDLLNKIPTIR